MQEVEGAAGRQPRQTDTQRKRQTTHARLELEREPCHSFLLSQPAEEFELAEDEEIEAYYFSSAAGRARVVLENRRFGAGVSWRAPGVL